MSDDAFIVAGMHRSGTSMAAAILQSCGVHMGERLMGPSRGNLRGHFENMDFVELHRRALAAQGHPDAGWISAGSVSLGSLGDQADVLIAQSAQRSGPHGWGWKDPRTTLFLEEWRVRLPRAHVVLLYRSPWEVLHSICRRNADEDQFFRDQPAEIVRVWRHYNQRVLEFARAHQRETLLVCHDAVVANPAAFVAAINAHFQVALPAPPEEVVDRKMVSSERRGSLPQLVLHAFPELLPMLAELDECSALRSESLERKALEEMALSHDFADAFRDLFEKGRRGAWESDGPSRAKLEIDLAWNREKVAALELQLQHQQAQLESLHRDREPLREHATALEEDRKRLRVHIQSLEGECERLRAHAQALEQQATARA